MKYIRTKDGRIIVPLIEPDVFDNQELESVEIAKVTDSIEELCDYFLFDDAFEYLNPSLYAHASTARLHMKNHENLVGYIVVKKNGVKTLEPVAKTNDEGEFELL